MVWYVWYTLRTGTGYKAERARVSGECCRSSAQTYVLVEYFVFLGRILTLDPETSWRKTPTHQGGFILDGGIHSIAGLRLMLAGASEDIVRVSAFTSQLQPHMPPIDSVDAACKTTSGVAGIAQLSFGTTFKGGGVSVACEHGVVTVVGKDVTIEKNGVEETKTFPKQTNGVKEEVLAWGKAILAGKQDERQTAEEALKDLKVLEAMFKSGEQDGAPLSTGVQEVR